MDHNFNLKYRHHIHYCYIYITYTWNCIKQFNFDENKMRF